MLKKFLGWLSDTYFYDYIVQREDFDQLQVRWQHSNGFIKRQQDEIAELLDSCYTKKHKKFAEDSHGLECVESNFERVDVRCQVFRWEVSIPDRVMYLSYNPREVVDLERQKAVRKLSESVTEHLAKAFFGKV